jgi:O-antigen ligase
VWLEAALIAAAVIGFFVMPDTFAGAKGRPGFLLPETMVSPYAHSNSLSASASLVAAYALASLFSADNRKTRRLWGSVVAVGTTAVVLSSGRQGVVIWLVAIIAVLWTMRRKLFVFLIAPLSAAIVILNWDPIWTAVQRGQSAASLATWSGRLTWWSAAIEVWKVHPWTGYGFGVGGRFATLGGSISLHSGYFEALTGVGLLGVIPLAVALLRVITWAARRLLAGEAVREAILVVPLVLHTLVSLGFGAWLQADFFLFAFLVILVDAAAGDRKKGVGATSLQSGSL